MWLVRTRADAAAPGPPLTPRPAAGAPAVGAGPREAQNTVTEAEQAASPSCIEFQTSTWSSCFCCTDGNLKWTSRCRPPCESRKSLHYNEYGAVSVSNAGALDSSVSFRLVECRETLSTRSLLCRASEDCPERECAKSVQRAVWHRAVQPPLSHPEGYQRQETAGLDTQRLADDVLRRCQPCQAGC